MSNKYPNSGSLSTNTKKEKETHPGYTGSVNITCPHCEAESDFWLSAWVREGKAGKFFSLAFKEKGAVTKEGVKEAKKAVEKDDFGDMDVPF